LILLTTLTILHLCLIHFKQLIRIQRMLPYVTIL
jgi:hypothetical protein